MVKVTFSILCFNYGQYLPQAIMSCMEQRSDGVECEILVIDDGSTDTTKEVCEYFKDEIRVISEGNKGFPASLTRAITCANGDFVFLLDADDYFLDGKLSACLPYLQSGKLFVCDQIYPQYEPEEATTNKHSGGSTSTLAINRKAALDIFPIENELSLHVLEQMGHGVRLNDAYTIYRYHDKSMTNRKEPGKQNAYLAGVTHRLADRIEALIVQNDYPVWFMPIKKAQKVASMYRALAYYNELEAALEQKMVSSAYDACKCMLKHALKSSSGIGTFQLKMIIRTILMRPSFKKY